MNALCRKDDLPFKDSGRIACTVGSTKSFASKGYQIALQGIQVEDSDLSRGFVRASQGKGITCVQARFNPRSTTLTGKGDTQFGTLGA